MAEHSGWRSFWWLNVALMSLTLVSVIFMFPETKWDSIRRERLQDNMATAPKLAVDKTEKVEDRSAAKIKTTSGNVTAGDSAEVGGLAPSDPYLGKGKPNKEQWRLYQPNKS